MHPTLPNEASEAAFWKGVTAVGVALWGVLAGIIKWAWGRLERRVEKLENAHDSYATKADIRDAVASIKERMDEQHESTRETLAEMKMDLRGKMDKGT